MKNIRQTSKRVLLSLILLIGASGAARAQKTFPKPVAAPKSAAAAPAAPKPAAAPAAPTAASPRETSEKLLAVDPKVNISLCVTEGKVKINGSDHSEVRIFVEDGSRIAFKILQKSSQNNDPVWIMAVNADAGKNSQSGECLYGDVIEIDVPRGAIVNVKGQETLMTIDSVRKASVKTIGGNIHLRNVAEGVEASTYEGDVSVENSRGAMTLDSAGGNIVAYGVSPSEIGDIFKAKTNNGAIALQNLDYRQIEVNSISGAVSYNGAFSTGGLYSFGTSNGTIALVIPPTTSCRFTASYGFGGFNSEIPIVKITENNTSRAQNIVGTMGGGDATLNLTTVSGAIRIKSKK